MMSKTLTAAQGPLAANTPTIVLWSSDIVAQTVNSTGLTYAAGVFTNNTTVTLPLLIEYALFLNVTGTGSSYIRVGSTNYAIRYNTDNAFTNSYTILLAPSATFSVYYTDAGTPTIQTSSTISVTLLTAGAQGVTGPTGAVGSVATISYSQSTQTSPATQAITAGGSAAVVNWGAVADTAQSQGSIGLSYSAGVFTNTTLSPMVLLVEYNIRTDITGGGVSFVGVTVSSVLTQYGTMLNDNNSFANSYTVVLPAAASFGVYYMDNLTCNIQTDSRVSATLLVAGQQGATGPVGQVAILSQTASSQSASLTATTVKWPTVDAGQSTGNTNMIYANGTGLFTNNNASTLPFLVEYSINLNTTTGGYSYVGITTGGVTTPYGGMYNDSNGFTNSYSVLVPSGSTLGIYYMDNLGSGATIQTSSRIALTLLTAGQAGATGQVGPTGPVGSVAALSKTAGSQSAITASTVTLLTWLVDDLTQSTGNIGLSYAAGQFTNTTASTLPLLVEYTVFLNTSAGGYSAIGVNGTASTYGTAYGGMYNTTNGFNNSYSLLLAPGATVGIYYSDNGTPTVQSSSRVTITLLSAGQQGATGAQGVSASSSVVSLYPSATQTITANTLTTTLWDTRDAAQSTTTLGAMGLNYAAGLFTNTTTTTMPLSVDYSMFLNVTGGGYTVITVTSGGSTTTYGGRYNDNVAVTNSFTILLAPNASLGVSYMDNATATVQTTSRLTLTLLVAGLQGPTGPSVWGATGTTAYYTSGNVIVGTGTAPADLSVIGTINSITVGGGTGGVSNTVVGQSALAGNVSGTNNMAIGYAAGYTTTPFSGTNNVYVGALATPYQGASNSNEIVIGQGATGYGSNTVTIGNASTVSTTLFGTVRNLSYPSVTVTSPTIAAVIATGTNVITAAGAGVWLVSVNASGKQSAVGYLAYDGTNTTVFGGFSTSASLSIVGGNGTTTGSGLYLVPTNAVVNGTYKVNLLKLN